jgi:hypothetical protein
MEGLRRNVKVTELEIGDAEMVVKLMNALPSSSEAYVQGLREWKASSSGIIMALKEKCLRNTRSDVKEKKQEKYSSPWRKKKN